MALKVTKADMWAAGIDDRSGGRRIVALDVVQHRLAAVE